MLTYPKWVGRRVEQISFVDARTTRRRISVDFRLPSAYASPAGFELKTWYVPLALLRKKDPLVDFDLLDEEGRALPLVAREETQQVATATLVSAAASTLEENGESLSREMSLDLQKLAACPPELARQTTHRVLQSRHGRLLARNPHTRPLLEDLAECFLVLISISDPHERRVIKFSYLEEFELPAPRVSRELGWRSIPFIFPTTGVSMAHSYHCEISAPPNLEVLQAKLAAKDPSGKKTDAFSHGGGQRVHLWLQGVPHANGRLIAHLRAGRPGMPQTAALFAVSASLLLTAAAIFHWRNGGEAGNTAAALLVAIPALLAAYLSRPEHQLAGRLLRGIRWLTAGVGLLAFLAAASTVVLEPTFAVWIAIAGVAWLFAFALCLSAILPGSASEP